MAPVPVPARADVRVKVARAKLAVTSAAVLIVTVHTPVPVHPPPLHPLKVEEASGAAVRVTTVPLAYASAQSGPQVTPAFEAVATTGRRFTRAHATVPETLPSHASMLTGLYPGGHGVHENGRTVADAHPLVADALAQRGYQTSAVVSAFVLARRFGLARGFAASAGRFRSGSPPAYFRRTAGNPLSSAERKMASTD